MSSKVTVTIRIGERETVIPLTDPRAIGLVANGIGNEFEKLYDGHGNVIDPETQAIATDLGVLLNETDAARNQVLGEIITEKRESAAKK